MPSLARSRLVGLLVLLGACGGPPAGFKNAVATDTAPKLHEGLPHPAFESEALEAERRTKDVEELHGYPFYRATLALDGADASTLRELFVDGSSLEAWSGEKKCGGFHPDYAVEWATGGERYLALLCFGCEEVKLIGPGLDARHDLRQGASDELEALLAKYRKNRPAEGQSPTTAKP